MVNPEKLRSDRDKLFRECVSPDSFEALLKVQLSIAAGIRRTESLLRDNPGNSSLIFHIQRLRLYADGLVWLVLHPHVIRQLATNADVPKSLLEQREAFDLVLRSARRHFKQSHVPVLIADITNVIKIGDLVLVTNTEAPTIVETKKRLPKPEHLMQGRIGRQVSRAMGTLTYLSEGTFKVHGDDHYRHVVESAHQATRNWAVVESLCLQGLEEGFASSALSEHQVMWVYARNRDDTLKSEVKRWRKEGSRQLLGTSLGLMNRRDGLFPPPGVWPISSKARFALLEEDIVLVHLVDIAAFECIRGNGESIRIDLSGDYPVRVTTGGKEYPLALRFVYDVLYGFETVQSCVDGLFDFARQLANLLPQDIEARSPQKKPTIHPINGLDEAVKVVHKASSLQDDFVAIAPGVLRLLRIHLGSFRASAEEISGQLGPYGAYAIMTVRDFLKAWDKSAFSRDSL